MKKKMNKAFMVCLAATAMTAGMSVSAFAQVHIGGTTYNTFMRQWLRQKMER